MTFSTDELTTGADRHFRHPRDPVSTRTMSRRPHCQKSDRRARHCRRRPYSRRQRQYRRILRADARGGRDDGARGLPSTSTAACRCSPASGAASSDACRLASASMAAGADALMVHQPPDPSPPRAASSTMSAASPEAADGLPLMLYLRNDTIGTRAIADLCAIDGVAGVKWATPNAAEAWRSDRRGRSVDRLGRRPCRDLGAAALCRRCPRLHLRADQCLARALGGDPCSTRGRRLCTARDIIRGMRLFEDIRAEEMNGTNVTGVKAALADAWP